MAEEDCQALPLEGKNNHCHLSHNNHNLANKLKCI